MQISISKNKLEIGENKEKENQEVIMKCCERTIANNLVFIQCVDITVPFPLNINALRKKGINTKFFERCMYEKMGDDQSLRIGNFYIEMPIYTTNIQSFLTIVNLKKIHDDDELFHATQFTNLSGMDDCKYYKDIVDEFREREVREKKRKEIEHNPIDVKEDVRHEYLWLMGELFDLRTNGYEIVKQLGGALFCR